MTDINSDSIGDDIVGITISEFGRKAQENGSFGTDHGEVAPVFVFGKPIKSGISGVNVDLSEANQENNYQIETVQFDYRQAIATLMQDFLAADDNNINNTFVENTTNASFVDSKIENLIKSSHVVPDSCLNQGLGLDENINKNWLVFPNPFSKFINIESLAGFNQDVFYQITNQFGQIIFTGKLNFENNRAKLNLSSLNTGIYVLTVKTKQESQSYKILKRDI
jgi:hypothetical protein